MREWIPSQNNGPHIGFLEHKQQSINTILNIQDLPYTQQARMKQTPSTLQALMFLDSNTMSKITILIVDTEYFFAPTQSQFGS